MRQPPMKGNMNRLRYWRRMPFIKCGMRVLTAYGAGRVTSTDGDLVRILLDGKQHPALFHPWWQMVYYNGDGTIIQDYRQS